VKQLPTLNLSKPNQWNIEDTAKHNLKISSLIVELLKTGLTTHENHSLPIEKSGHWRGTDNMIVLTLESVLTGYWTGQKPDDAL